MQFNLNKIKINIEQPYNKIALDFIDEFSSLLRKHKNFKKYPDLHFLSLWSSKKEILKKKNYYNRDQKRFGRGLVFHVTPSNLPTNFAYSFLVGILSGNSNIVKLPSKTFEETKIILEVINTIFKLKKFKKFKLSNFFIEAQREDPIMSEISSVSDARLLWGGDKAINALKQIKTPERCLDLAFPDRYSFAVINISKYFQMSNKEKINLSKKFFYDSMLSDQLACNSPHCVVWVGKTNYQIQKLFWRYVEKNIIEKYRFDNYKSIEKYSHFLKATINGSVNRLFFNSDCLKVINLKDSEKDLENYRGIYGFFYQTNIDKIDDLKKFVKKKYQSIVSFGFAKNNYCNLINNNNLVGIDRVVSFGQAMRFDFNWDGYDLINSLSRIVEIDEKI